MSAGKVLLRLVEENPPPCTTEYPELFFPNETENETNLRQIEEAKTVCRKCPIIAECLRFAWETEDKFAVMGMSTPDERVVMLQKREERAAKRERWAAERLETGLAA